MPRKFPNAKKQEWLELYEQGKSEKWIAHRAGCDTRTVKKGITDASLKRDVVLARIEVVKDALRKHQDDLIEELERIISDLVMPEKDHAPISWHRGANSVFGDIDGQVGPRSIEDTVMRRLLKEHLRQDKLWRVLAEWGKANAHHMAARMRLQRRTVTLIQEKTGYNVIDGDGPPPFVCSYTAGLVLYKGAIDMAFATPEERAGGRAIKIMESAISIGPRGGDVSFENRLILAVVPGSEQRTKQQLLEALKDLSKSEEVGGVVETHQTLERTTTKARQTAEMIRLVGLVPGQCEICRRLGM